MGGGGAGVEVTCRLAYGGSFKFAPRMVMATDTIAIMMPKSMTFKGGASTPYTPVTEETNAQRYVARNVAPSQALDFTVSGSGQLPRDSQAAAAAGAGGAAGAADASPQPGAGNVAATDTRPGGGLGNPLDPEGTNDPWAKEKGGVLGGLGAVLGGGVGIMLEGNGHKPVNPGEGGWSL